MIDYEYKCRGPFHQLVNDVKMEFDNIEFLNKILADVANSLRHIEDKTIQRVNHLDYEILGEAENKIVNWQYSEQDDISNNGPGITTFTTDGIQVVEDDVLLLKQAIRFKRINGSYLWLKYTKWYILNNSDKSIKERLAAKERYSYTSHSWSGPIADYVNLINHENMSKVLDYWIKTHSVDQQETELYRKFINYHSPLHFGSTVYKPSEEGKSEENKTVE